MKNVVCDCVAKFASNGSVCHSAECLMNDGSMNAITTAESLTKRPHIANFNGNRSLSTSLPDLASPSDEFRGLSFDS